MKTGFFIGPNDLNMAFPVVPKDPDAGPLLMVESVTKGNSHPWHFHKLVHILASYRRFAEHLRQQGFDVHLVRARTYVSGLRKLRQSLGLEAITAMRPREYATEKALLAATEELNLTLLDDGGVNRPFLLAREDFEGWADGRKQFRMDQFYAWMRKRFEILLEPGRKPTGGKWSYDADNRHHARGTTPPEIRLREPGDLELQVMEEVAEWHNGPGTAQGFSLPTTRQHALDDLDTFLEERLPLYGRYQDAMLTGHSNLWHSLIAPALNIGLLLPQEVIDGALEKYETGRAPLNSVEGFIRQVLGWREYIRGMYWETMPGLRDANRFKAELPLPAFFWTGETSGLHCLDESIKPVLERGYANHIQRLMVIGNYCLLTGINPREVSEWFWSAFVDAADWVQLPNVHGMALAADTTFTTKPYAASASYIHKMSDYCSNCQFNHKERSGPGACPFNSQFWDFMLRHRETLSQNPRLGMLYRTSDKWSEEQRKEIQGSAVAYRRSLPGPWKALEDYPGEPSWGG